MPKVSAVLIAQNEADRIEATLRSVAFCDEVLVVDGGSHDATTALVSATGARLIERPFDGFVAQKNFAVRATDWYPDRRLAAAAASPATSLTSR